MKKKTARLLLCVTLVAVMAAISSVTVFAAGDVAGAIENTWTQAQTQIKTVVNNVVFPVIDMILAILFFVNIVRKRLKISGLFQLLMIVCCIWKRR